MSGLSGSAESYLSAEGRRLGKFFVQDKAGNEVSVTIEAMIDRTNPACSTKKSNLNTTDGVTVDVICSDGESGCDKNSYVSREEKQTSSKTYTVKDNAGNSKSCSVEIFGYDCQPHNCNPHKCHSDDGTTTESYSCEGNVVSYGGSCCSDGGGSCVQQWGYLKCSCSKTVTVACSHTCWDTCYYTCYK